MENEKKKNPIKDEDLDQVTGGINNDGSTVLKVDIKNHPNQSDDLEPVIIGIQPPENEDGLLVF